MPGYAGVPFSCWLSFKCQLCAYMLSWLLDGPSFYFLYSN